MSASLAAVMVTPGSTALVVSVTVPSIVPVVAPTVWPAAPCAHNSRYATDETRTLPGRNTSFPSRRIAGPTDGHSKPSARACCASSGAAGDPSAGTHHDPTGGLSDETSSATGSDNSPASKSVRFAARRRFIRHGSGHAATKKGDACPCCYWQGWARWIEEMHTLKLGRILMIAALVTVCGDKPNPVGPNSPPCPMAPCER
jgi:hypothetical protein